jgi:ketosteroid isomerase-like protein
VDAATEVLDPDVRWYGAGAPGAEGACHSREEARAFIRRALAQGVRTDLLEVHDAGDGRLVLVLRPRPRAGAGDVPGPHGEVVTVRDGKVVEMVVHPTVEDAMRAAGRPG